MAFRERLELIVDVVTGNSSGNIKNLTTDLEGTEGAFGKIKSSATGAFDNVKSAASGMVDNITQNIAGFALAGAGALAGFAVKAIGDFQDTALGAAGLRDSLGITAEEASRLQEVAGDLGISVGTLETSMGRMNREAENAPDKFDKIGAAIARNKDGTTNTTETYLNVIEALKGIKDPAERAARAQEILGKSWMDSAELIELGADGVRTAMASVEDAKIIDDNEIAQAREFRDMLDGLKGTLESVSLTVGQELVPVLSDAGEAIQALVGPLQDVRSAYDSVTGLPVIKQVYENVAPWESWRTRIDQVGDAFNAVTGKSDDMQSSYNQAASEAAHLAREQDGVAQVADDLTGIVGGLVPQIEKVASNETAAATNADILAEAQRIAADGAAKLNEQLLAQVDALNEQIDALRSSADATIAVDEAQEAFAEAAQKTVDVMKDAESTARDLDAAVDGERDAMIAAADAAVKMGNDHATASGKTQTAQQRIDTFNDSLLSNAQFATPAARDAIADYINEANGVPEEKATAIKAAIAAGDFATARTLLNDVSSARTAAINADARTGQAESDLNYLARPRTVVIAGQMRVEGARAGGGTVYQPGGETTLVGENGPEIVRLPTGSHVMKASESRGYANGEGGGGAVVYNVTINALPGMRPNDIVDAIKKYERTNGTSWRR